MALIDAVIGGDEGDAAAPRGQQRAPRRRARPRMHQRDVPLTDQSRERAALAQIVRGFFESDRACGSARRRPRCSSGASRPPRVATSAVQPVSVSARAMSMVVRSAPPVSSAGTICRIAGTAGSAAQAPLWSSMSVSSPKAMTRLMIEQIHPRGRRDHRLFAARREESGRGLARRVPFRHERHQGAGAGCAGPSRAAAPICASTISATAHRRARSATARSRAGATTRSPCSTSSASGPQVLVGSSMGAWIALLVARARPEKVAALLLLAPAADFTEALIWARMTPDIRREIMERGAVAASVRLWRRSLSDHARADRGWAAPSAARCADRDRLLRFTSCKA